MKLDIRKASLFAALAALFSFASPMLAATAEITKSGSTWTGRVDGVTRYTGTSLSAAVYACTQRMGAGPVNVRAGGATAEMRIFAGQTMNGFGNTFTGSGTLGIVRAQNVSNTGARNMRMAGTSQYGVFFRSNSGQTFSGISGGTGILMRVDNGAGSAGSNFNGGSPTGTAGGSHAVETYGINTATLGTVTATDRGECGLLWNQTTGGRVTTINATRCGRGTGYAGYRLANNNRDSNSTGTVTANAGGRGFFALTGTNNCTAARVNARDNQGIGIWIQDCVNVRVNAGSVINNGAGCRSVSGSGSVANVTCG